MNPYKTRKLKNGTCFMKMETNKEITTRHICHRKFSRPKPPPENQQDFLALPAEISQVDQTSFGQVPQQNICTQLLGNMNDEPGIGASVEMNPRLEPPACFASFFTHTHSALALT